MSFQPIVPLGGTAGWLFLQRTREAQEQAFTASPAISRPSDYFREKIATIGSAEDLVSDRRLLSVALGAFGLDDDINSRFFIRKVLEEGTKADDSLANRLADKRYLALSQAFGFGDTAGGNVRRDGFANDILKLYEQRQFEAAVGQSNPDMRLALGLERDLSEIAGRSTTNNGLWFTIMATPPLRTVFERAFNLPTSVGALDIDRQLNLFKERAESQLGTSEVREIVAPEKLSELTRRFFISSDLVGAPGPSVRGSAALAILNASAGPARLLV